MSIAAYERAQVVFEEKYEMFLFNSLKAGRTIFPATLKSIRLELERRGLDRKSASEFIEAQLEDMRCQIDEEAAKIGC